MAEIIINKESKDKKIKMIRDLHEMGHNLFTDMASRLDVDYPDEESLYEESLPQRKANMKNTNYTGEYAKKLAYAVNDDCTTCTITGIGNFTGCLLNIPPEINGYKVTGIARDAFFKCASLIRVTIPDSVTKIGNGAFESCDSLMSVTVGNGVTSIGMSAFYKCDALTSITIPDGVTKIVYAAFAGCSSLKSIIIPDGVTSISEYAFFDCKSLTSVIIPDGVTSIGLSAFRGCSSLKSITVPNSITRIGGWVFNDCRRLSEINFTGTMSQWNNIKKDGGWDYGTGSYVVRCTGEPIELAYTVNADGKTCTVIGPGPFKGPVGIFKGSVLNLPTEIDGYRVTSIGSYAFPYCSSLTSVIIPDTVTSIGESAFSNCRSLTNVVIGNSVRSIGVGAFACCGSLKSITIPDSVTWIGDYAFYECDGLVNVAIPDGVMHISDNAFSNCTRLTSMTIGNGVEFAVRNLFLEEEAYLDTLLFKKFNKKFKEE